MGALDEPEGRTAFKSPTDPGAGDTLQDCVNKY